MRSWIFMIKCKEEKEPAQFLRVEIPREGGHLTVTWSAAALFAFPSASLSSSLHATSKSTLDSAELQS